MEITPFYSGRAFYDVTGDNGEKYVFVPKEFVEKGFVKDGTQFYEPAFLQKDALSKASEYKLPTDENFTTAAKQIYQNPTDGYIWKASDFSALNPDDYSFETYQISSDKPAITGLMQYEGSPVYQVGKQAGYEGYDYSFLTGFDPATKQMSYTHFTPAKQKSKGGLFGFLSDIGEGILDISSALGPIGTIALNAAVPGLGTAISLGTATGYAAGTGNIEKALPSLASAYIGSEIAPEISGGISEAVGGGTLGNIVGQSATSAGMAALTGGDVEQAALMGAISGAAKPIDVGINTPLTPAQIESGLGTEGYGYSTAAAESGLFNPAVIGSGAYTQTSYPIDMAELAAADAIQLAQQTGNNPAAMEQNLVASGIDPLIAADLSQQVVLNPTATSMDLANNLIQTYGSDIYDKSIEQINAEKEAAIQPEVAAVTPQTEIPWDKLGKLVAGMLTGGAAMAAANQPAPAPVAAAPAYQPLTGMPAYSPEYFQSVQQYYNSYMPNMPQDVVTPLSDWYSSGYTEPDSVTASLFNLK